jgi:hypothetical protein
MTEQHTGEEWERRGEECVVQAKAALDLRSQRMGHPAQGFLYHVQCHDPSNPTNEVLETP